MIHKFSFDFRDPYIDFEGLEFAFRIVTMENVYGPAPEAITVTKGKDRVHLEAALLQYAGGQGRCPGRVAADIWLDGARLRLSVEGRHREVIKATTTLVRGLAAPVEQEVISRWPTVGLEGSPFPEIPTLGGGTATILPSSAIARQRRWSVYQEYSGSWVFNLSEDQAYTERTTEIRGSEWHVFRDLPGDEALDRWYGMVETERGLRSWDEREDVPSWLRQVSLVLNMHCEGWTGFVFNTFDRQLEILRWVADRIDGRRVLVYLPGWDGRYYWNYPIYEPSERCGGSDGLQRLVDGAHELGMHVVPMFSLIASGYHNTRRLGLQDAACRTSDDLEEICAWTEWDEDLATDEIWQSLNVGHVGFRQYLQSRIFWVTDTFETDGAMLDISGWMPRDPRHDLLAGLETLVHELLRRYPDYLVFGEHGCELHMPLFPLFHHAAGLPSRHPFHRYCRTAYHLNFAAPGKGSSGVHERGRNQYVRPTADRPAIPTLAVVHHTLPDESEEVAAVIQVATQWADHWCR